jgi:hypothetical protein
MLVVGGGKGDALSGIQNITIIMAGSQTYISS